MEGRGWINAGQLQVGDAITTVNGDQATVAASFTTQHASGLTVYNLEVEGARTFFVNDGADGVSAVWVHNASYLRHVIGRRGEYLAKVHLKARGYSDFVVLRNGSNHGVDVLARNKSGVWEAFEVKASSGSLAPRLSADQAKGAQWYVTNRLRRIAAGDGAWGRTSERVRAKANAILDQIAMQPGGLINGQIINITNVPTKTRNLSSSIINLLPWIP